MIQNDIPDWLKQTQQYTPQKDKNKFIEKTQNGLLRILAKIKMQSEFGGKKIPSPAIALFVLFEMIFLTVLSKNLQFVFLLLGILIVYLAFFPAKMIRNIILEVCSGVTFAFFFSLPAYLMGNHYTMQQLVLKTAVTVCSVAIFTHRIPFYRLSHTLSKTPLSDTILFIFDITLKYLVVLGRICTYMTEALKLRSIGHNRKKQNTAAGILGVTYLKSQAMSKEMYQAMACRGFDGTYQSYGKHKWIINDAALLVAGVLILVVFIVL